MLNLFNAFDGEYLVITGLVLTAPRIIYFFNEKNKANAYYKETYYVLTTTLLFCLLWLIVFSSNKWIAMNQYSYRYFTFVIYGTFIFFAIESALFMSLLGNINSNIAAIGTLASVLLILIKGFVPLSDYKIFRVVNTTVHDSYAFYAGDYWMVWPAVLKEMLAGYESYGLTYRGDGNMKNARIFFDKQLKSNGKCQVLCLNDNLQRCQNQIFHTLGSVNIQKQTRLSTESFEFVLAGNPKNWRYFGKDLTFLPCKVGIVIGHQRQSDETAGFLVYGPYVHIPAGDYSLRIYGHCSGCPTAYADIVSAKGAIIYAKFLIPCSVQRGLLIEEKVHIPTNADDVEIRIWVSQNDHLTLNGYELLSE